MGRKCDISGSSRQSGNRVSHANNKSRHVFEGNIQSKRVYNPETQQFVRVRVSTRMIRTIDKLGLSEALRKYKVKLSDLA
ncbi:MAG: 50S ribosomal protein L28 [Bdellovibrionales bacterium]|nr:50S ribosomal protein L28 [Bdellovibrionales bacterium]